LGFERGDDGNGKIEWQQVLDFRVVAVATRSKSWKTKNKKTH
jgi:hypothetical protein